jgi:coenzyme F420-reducing hydrogenase alpha subunit
MIARTIRVDYLARVEGEVSLTVKLKGREATEVKLSVFEPPRFFEAFLRGRSMLEVPDITARICGICPVAYQLAGSPAVEDALGVALDAELRAMRRLLMCGEWIESHALHAFMLHAPDFLGYPDGIAMAKDHPERVREGLRIKRAGNALMTALGGREIHPVNVRVGGFYRAPAAAELRVLLPELRWAQGAALESLAWMKGFDFPVLNRDYEFVALQATGEYPMTEGRIVSSKGLDLPVRDYETVFVEEHVPYSNALFARLRERGAYLCGPLARFNLNADRLSPPAREAAEVAGLVAPMTNPFRSLLVRMVETVEALAEAIRLIEAYQPPSRAFAELPHRAGTGAGCVEAPRGLLFHRYEVSADGTIRSARIIPPTSQNQRIMEEDIYALAPRLADQPLAEATLLAEQAIRNYDPCISCATHYLTLRLERE